MNKELEANTNLSHYRIVSKIGAGGMGEVYRAHDARLDREVAIKVLPADFAADKDRLQRFEQEAKAPSALNPPNILTGIVNLTSRRAKSSDSERRFHFRCLR